MAIKEIRTEKTKRVKKIDQPVDPVSTESSFFDYLRFGESYTSLILGIIAVVVVTILLLGFVHNRNLRPQTDTTSLQANQTNGYQSNLQPTQIPTDIPADKILVSPTPTSAPAPTSTPTPTRIVATHTITKAHPSTTQVKISPTKAISMNKSTLSTSARIYTVKLGDNLWQIAQKNYKSGYNWVDIARANNLSNPNSIKIGDKLILPKAEQKNATSEPEYVASRNPSVSNSMQSAKITGTSYTIIKGDNLWNISVRAYGDGYQWVKIANVNHLLNPNLIFAGNKLTIPRN